MTTALDRGLSLIERLAGQPEGMSLSALADELLIPHGACHRLLAELQRRGYVRQVRSYGDYVLTTKVASLGLGFLSSAGIVDIAEPLLERVAKESGELVRLSIVDDDRLTWVAKCHGARKGLRYDPDMGMDARLSCTSSGHAWLLTLSDERALELVTRQGFGQPKDYGPNAPTTVKMTGKVETMPLTSGPSRSAVSAMMVTSSAVATMRMGMSHHGSGRGSACGPGLGSSR